VAKWQFGANFSLFHVSSFFHVLMFFRVLLFPCASLLLWSFYFATSLCFSIPSCYVACVPLCFLAHVFLRDSLFPCALFFRASLFLHVLMLLYGSMFFCVSLFLHASLFTYVLILRCVSLLPFSSTFMFLVISLLLCFVYPSCFITPLPNVLEIRCCKFGVWEKAWRQQVPS
jgi:hypothetical protein